ncbi:hypothetical protein [Pseudomonas sp. EA_35y_Pfl2_R5]|uniref:hypothetical protein n=1 Tax=Pseudomonas sp. EA_35y_Pfl2_R5 TaxID=3088690 RepID=UPI0030DCA7B2
MEMDIETACLISAAAPIIVILNGDYLYIGLWYYLLLPALIIGANYFLTTASNICCGMALALQLSFFIFFYWQHQINQGLLGLIHICFLLPSAAISSTAGFILLKNNSALSTLSGLTYDFFSFAIGATAGMAIYFSS